MLEPRREAPIGNASPRPTPVTVIGPRDIVDRFVARARARPPSAAWRPSGAGRRRRRGRRGAAPARPRRPARSSAMPGRMCSHIASCSASNSAHGRAHRLDLAGVLDRPLRQQQLGAVDDLAENGAARSRPRAGGEHVELHPERTVAQLGPLDRREPRALAHALDPRRAPRQLGVAPREQDRLAPRRHEQVARLAGARQVVDVGRVHDQRRRHAGLRHGGGEALDAAQNTGVST